MLQSHDDPNTQHRTKTSMVVAKKQTQKSISELETQTF